MECVHLDDASDALSEDNDVVAAVVVEEQDSDLMQQHDDGDADLSVVKDNCSSIIFEWPRLCTSDSICNNLFIRSMR